MVSSFLKSDGAAILAVFIGAIIAVTFISPIADEIFTQTNTLSVVNSTVSTPAVNGTTDLLGRELIGSAIVTNATNATVGQIPTLTVRTGIGTDGLLTVQIFQNDTNLTYASSSVNVSYNYNPDGYISLAGGRSIAALIVLFGALAIVIFVIVMFIMKGSFGEFIRKGR